MELRQGLGGGGVVTELGSISVIPSPGKSRDLGLAEGLTDGSHRAARQSTWPHLEMGKSLLIVKQLHVKEEEIMGYK